MAHRRVAHGRVAHGRVAHRRVGPGKVGPGKVVVVAAWGQEGLAEGRVLEADRFRGLVSRRACRRAAIRGCIPAKDFRREFPGGAILGFRHTRRMGA